MSLVDRIWRVIRANINSLIDEIEDPEKILEMAVVDMQQDLIELRRAVAGAIASQKRTERQMAQNKTTAQQWYRRAQLALKKGDENLARVALARRESYQTAADTLLLMIKQQKGIIDKLKQDLRTLEGKILEAKTKKDIYIARARSAIASQKIHELSGNLNSGTSLNLFERLEDKVIELEAQQELMLAPGTDNLEQKFAALEGDNVETELAKMKAQLKQSSDTGRLPSTSGDGGKKYPIDGELEQLRSELDGI